MRHRNIGWVSATCWLAVLLSVVLTPVHAVDDFRVVVSIKPIHSILAGLMAGIDGPELLIGEGQTPYDFTLTEQQHEQMKNADLLFWVGPDLEASLEQAMREMDSQTQVIELLDNPAIKILPSRVDGNRRDPFFWLDNRNITILLNDFARLLQAADPARTHVYARNRRRMMKRLSRMDRAYEYDYRGLKAGLAVQYYDTLQYFEQAYALTVLDRVSESPRHRLDTESLLKVRQHITDGSVACLLTERGMPSKHLGLLTEGQDVNLGELDSLGTHLPAGEDLYFELMRYNTDTIKRCLNADRQSAQKVRLPAGAGDGSVVDDISSGRFMLTDHYGGLVTDETMRGRYQLLYFGYTYCPDICPNTLQIVSLALDRLGDQAALVQPYFVTVDPERDTVKVLRDYIEYFDPRLIGITGSKAMIERMTAQYKVKYEKVIEKNTDPNLYLMDHSASLYLLAPDGSFLSKFIYGLSADQLVQELKKYILAN